MLLLGSIPIPTSSNTTVSNFPLNSNKNSLKNPEQTKASFAELLEFKIAEKDF